MFEQNKIWIIKQAEKEMQSWERSFINTIYTRQYLFHTDNKKAAN